MVKRIELTETLRELPTVGAENVGWPWSGPKRIKISEDNSTAPRISIVTPSFQQASTIESTLRSVLLQNYPHLELIVIDGGSTDGTVEILKKYAGYLTYWVSEKDRGQSHAINKGLEHCTGDLFNWLNSDDMLEPGALHEVARVWQRTRPTLISGGCDNVKEDGTLQHRWVARPPRRLHDFFVPNKVVLAQPSTFVKTSIVRALGGIREDLECVMDWELYVRLVLSNAYPWSAEKTSFKLARALQHPAAKTQRLAALFPKEAARLMNEWLREAPTAERDIILARKKMLATETLITLTAAQSTDSLAALLRLPLEHWDVLRSRFYWGALRRAWGVI